MQVDYLIIGQGISGTWLSYFLQKGGKSVIVIDDNDPLASSRLAAGVMNPVTGRRHVEVWLADKILPFAAENYDEIGKLIGMEVIRKTSLIDFFPSAQMRESFFKRIEEGGNYLQDYGSYPDFYKDFNFEFGCGLVAPVYIVQLDQLLPAWRRHLESRNALWEEKFDSSQLTIQNDKVLYNDISASRIIFCDGHHSFWNPYFKLLPFAPNKGEIIIAEIPGLAPNHIYKKGMVMVPLSKKDHWWIGSSYAWEFDDDLPTQEFMDKTKSLLDHWLKHPYRIISHTAGIRPATIERRPFVGMHPQHQQVGILNGMGTKGCSLAPYFAKQMADHLSHQMPIDPEAAIIRFQKILARHPLG